MGQLAHRYLIDEKVEGTDRYYAVHNIGAGPQKEDVYYDEYDLDHYRWKPYEVATNDASTLNK